MNRKPIIAGNWKSNGGTAAEAKALASEILKSPAAQQQEVEIVLCPPFTTLAVVGGLVRGSRVALGAQNLHWEASGAFTGEVSGPMLKDAGCKYCIVGHSERRQLFGETDELVQRKTGAALAAGLDVILCVGETLEIRQAGRTWETVKTQLQAALEKVAPEQIEKVTVAYEPVWAIGTGQNATPAQAQEVHAAIRGWLSGKYGKPIGYSLRIQYGGSVKPDNAAELLSQPDVDGALVGGASLKAAAFIPIVEAALKAKGAQCSTG